MKQGTEPQASLILDVILRLIFLSVKSWSSVCSFEKKSYTPAENPLPISISLKLAHTMKVLFSVSQYFLSKKNHFIWKLPTSLHDVLAFTPCKTSSQLTRRTLLK